MNTPHTKRHVIVVGAGLAGLCAAYELLKTGKYTVEIFEELERVGGRVHSVSINGQMIDVGGFIIYPWYEEYHRLINELNITTELQPIVMKPIFYEMAGPNGYVHEDDLKFPTADTVKLWARSAPSIFLNRDIAEPKLDTYYDKTISQYMRETLGKPEHAGMYETFTDIVSQGYCYGPVDEYRAAFITPIIRYTKLYGDIKAAFYFPNGNSIMPHAIVRAIQELGGVVHLGEKVITYKDKIISTEKGEYRADSIIFAQRVEKALYSQILPDIEIDAKYTHFYTAILQCDTKPRVLSSEEWGGVFYKPNPTAAYQVLSSINLSALYGETLDTFIAVNVRVLSDHTTDIHPITPSQLFGHVQTEITDRFPDTKCVGIEALAHWPQTMPVVTEQFVREIRKRQGRNNVFFAGDYLGGPSMETALQTGSRAAQAVIHSYE